MWLVSLLAASLPSVAGDASLFVKIDTEIYQKTSRSVVFDKKSLTDFDETQSGLSLGNGSARLALGTFFGENFEIGAALGVATSNYAYDPESGKGSEAKGTDLELLGNLAYRHVLSDEFSVAAGPLVGVSTTKRTGSSEYSDQWLHFGAQGVGTYQLNKVTGVEFGLEYLLATANEIQSGGESLAVAATQTRLGVRTGVRLLF